METADTDWRTTLRQFIATMSPTDTTDDITWREKGQALYRVGKFHPALAVAIVVLSVVAALLEGIGLGFIMPILEVAQGEQSAEDGDAFLEVFFTLYETLGIPFTLGYLVAGVTAVMTVRFTTSFLVNWLSAAIVTKYVRHLQEEAFNHAIEAEVSYFDREGSDDILNAIVTQAEYAGSVIQYALRCVEQGLLAAMYLAIALVLAPWLTLGTMLVLGGVVALFKFGLESGSSVGDRVAKANEEVQQSAQAGTQGVRDVKLFGMQRELLDQFNDSIEKFATSTDPR